MWHWSRKGHQCSETACKHWLAQADQHIYLFINFNAKQAGAHGHAQFHFIHFDFFFFFFVDPLFLLLLTHYMKCWKQSAIYKYSLEIPWNLKQFLHGLSQKHCTKCFSLRKHACSNIWKISPPKNWKFSDKNSDIFHISAQNIDCGYSLEPPRQGGSNEYPQSMFYAVIRKIRYTPLNPSFTI